MDKALAILLLLVSPLAAQDVQVQTVERMAVSGLENPVVLADGLILADKGSQPKLVPIGTVEFTTEAKTVVVTAKDTSFNKIKLQQVKTDKPNHFLFVTYHQGKSLVTVTAHDFDQRIFHIEEYILDVGKPAPLPPEIGDLEQLSRSLKPTDYPLLIEKMEQAIESLSRMEYSTSDIYRVMQEAIKTALLARPRGDQNDWTKWRSELDKELVKLDSREELLAAYKQIVKGLK
jgi:hypothetical protein